MDRAKVAQAAHYRVCWAITHYVDKCDKAIAQPHEPVSSKNLDDLEKHRLLRAFLNFETVAKLLASIHPTHVFQHFVGFLGHHEIEELVSACLYADDMIKSIVPREGPDELDPQAPDGEDCAHTQPFPHL